MSSIWLRVSVPIASFALPQAREFIETYPFPPPTTIYGMLLSLIGETNRESYVGTELSIIVKGIPESSVLIRKMRRYKEADWNHITNSKPDYQVILTNVQFYVRVSGNLAEAIENAFQTNWSAVSRFGGLSCGESRNLVDEITLVSEDEVMERIQEGDCWSVEPSKDGDWNVPVWADHVSLATTKWERASFEHATTHDIQPFVIRNR